MSSLMNENDICGMKCLCYIKHHCFYMSTSDLALFLSFGFGFIASNTC